MSKNSRSLALFESLKKDGLLASSGRIKFDFLNIETTVKSKSVVGDIIQDWLSSYMLSKKMLFRSPQNTQDFPDFFISNGTTEEMLEVKCFDAEASANFDIANFQAYCTSLLTNPGRLNSNYLIFSYVMDKKDFTIKIKNIWLKKVWEICGPSEAWPVKLQVKKAVIYNIRPISWDSERSQYKAFPSPKEFLDALDKTMLRYAPTHGMSRNGWLNSVISGYKASTGVDL